MYSEMKILSMNLYVEQILVSVVFDIVDSSFEQDSNFTKFTLTIEFKCQL